MPRFLYVQGVPERPVPHPYADAPGVFVGMTRTREVDAQGNPAERHTEVISSLVIQDCPHLRDAINKGELIQIAEPIVARDINEARAKFDAAFSAQKTARKGSAQ
jgi:hypothetical protein